MQIITKRHYCVEQDADPAKLLSIKHRQGANRFQQDRHPALQNRHPALQNRHPALHLIAALIWLLFISASLSALPKPPVAKEIPVHRKIDNYTLTDPYAWMSDNENPQTIRYLKAENAYAKAMLKPSAKLSKTLYKEFLGRIHESESSLPYLYKGYYYYTRNEQGKAYTIHCRKAASLSAPEEIVLDENELAKGQKFFSIGCFALSPNQKQLAYSVDLKGDEVYQLYIKNLATGKTAATLVTSISEVVWMADNMTLIYTTENARMQTDMCWRWTIGSKQTQCIYQEDDPGWDVSVYKSCDDDVIFASSSSKNAAEVYYLMDDDYEGRLVCLQKRSANHLYTPDYYQGRFYILTNQANRDFDLMTCDVGLDKLSEWQILHKGKRGEPISSFCLFDSNIVLQVREKGFECFQILDRQYGIKVAAIQPEVPMDLSFWVNTDPSLLAFTYTMESEILPLGIYSYDFYSGESTLLRTYPPKGEYQDSLYTTELRWVCAADSTMIPLRLTYRSGLDLSLPHPVNLYGYGAYGDCEDPYFSSTRLSLLDRDIICATAHIRGGGELGFDWYDDGRLLNKKNSFTDFIACMDYLSATGITTPDKLVIEGASAGGLLMGAVANLAAEKCALVIADVPFVDMMQTMLDDSLPLTVQEYEEWGNPNQKESFAYMLSYSPVDNVTEQAYPTMLISAGWNDTRVGYWEAAKWTATLRKLNTGKNPVIFRLYWNEGHTGQVDRYQSLKTYADTMAYILFRLGIK